MSEKRTYTAEDYAAALAKRENGGVATDWEHDYVVDAALRIAAKVARVGWMEDQSPFFRLSEDDRDTIAAIRKALLGEAEDEHGR